MTNKTIAASLVSKRDRDDVTAIKRMLSEHHDRSFVECVAIGEQAPRRSNDRRSRNHETDLRLRRPRT
ncbi:MAG: hypothetical protein ABSC06_34555 [Rhodopila sp.]|jgi:hypothetical protein